MKKCTRCGKKATKQTIKGKENEDIKGLPQNNGWFCKECWRKGDDEEKDIIYAGRN